MYLALSYFGCSDLNDKVFVFSRRFNDDQINDSVEIYYIENYVKLKGPTLPLPIA